MKKFQFGMCNFLTMDICLFRIYNYSVFGTPCLCGKACVILPKPCGKYTASHVPLTFICFSAL